MVSYEEACRGACTCSKNMPGPAATCFPCISQTRGNLPVQGRRLKVSHVVGLNSATELPGSEQQSQEVLNADSSNGDGHSSSPEGQSPAAEHPLLQQPPLEWFGPLAEELLALQPQKLGKVLPPSALPFTTQLSFPGVLA